MKFIFGIILIAQLAMATSKVSLGLNWKAEPEFGGFYSADQEGFYKRHKLDVKIIEGSAGIPITQMVASGKLEFGIASGDQIILANASGADLVALQTVYQKSPQCIMVRADSKIDSIEKLMKSDYTLSAGSGASWLTYLKNKYSPTKLKIVPYQGGIAAYLSDPKLAQQCFVGSEPELAEAQGIKTNVLVIADSGFDNFAAVLFTTRKYLNSHRDVVKNFVSASRQGWEFYLKDQRSAHKIITQLNPAMDPKTVDRIFKLQKPLIVGETKSGKFGSMNIQRWSSLVKQMVDLGLLKKEIETKNIYQQF